MRKLSVSEEIAVWSSIRASINSWVGLLATLLTSGTALFFIAFGVIIANSEKLGDGVSVFLAFGLFLGSIGFCLSIWNISNLLHIAAESARTLEDSLFGKEENIHKITHILSRHPLWGKGKPLNEYYKFWGFGLTLAAGILTIWRLLIWINFT